MQINKIQDYKSTFNPNFGIKFYTSQPLKHAIYESRDILLNPEYEKEKTKFLQKFCNSLARIIKSKKAEYISLYYSKNSNKCIITEFPENKDVLVLNCNKTKNNKIGRYFHSDSGANAMKALIKYAKTIKDVPPQKVSDNDLSSYPYRMLEKAFEDSLENIYF